MTKNILCIKISVHMTLIQSQISLLGWFSENDTFCLQDDIKKLKELPKEPFDRIEASLGCALDVLIENQLVKKFTKPPSEKNAFSKDYWVLQSSLSSINQSIECPMNLAIKISDTINSFIPLIDEGNENKSDPSNLAEADVIALLSIIEVMANRLRELENGDVKNGGEIER